MLRVERLPWLLLSSLPSSRTGPRGRERAPRATLSWPSPPPARPASGAGAPGPERAVAEYIPVASARRA
jgi:hypothetical protein